MAFVYLCVIFAILVLSNGASIKESTDMPYPGTFPKINRGEHCLRQQSIRPQGLYCQDPDTGKLHTVNSTWPSETFCGNYTCKLRKKNLTETEYTPIKKINITDIKFEDNTLNDMSISPSVNSVVIVKKDDDKGAVYKESKKNYDLKKELAGQATEDGDRYLTEKEIETITDILHTVKKSDLEAIVEIYNIAQDIYKEMDTAIDEKIVKETLNSIQQKTAEIDPQVKHKQTMSYWYEPLQYRNKISKDMNNEATNALPQFMTQRPAYFNGALTDRDFRKHPYYYPISNFQRASSYVYNPQTVPTDKPCKFAHNYYNPPSLIPTERVYTEPPVSQPAMLLPYPFSYIHHYNHSSYPSNLYYPWSQLDSYKKAQAQPYFGNTFIAQIPSQTIETSQEIEEIEEDVIKEAKEETTTKKPKKESLLEALKSSVEKKKLPDWQTEPLSSKVLEEVKANVLDTSKLIKPLSLRKNIKLERVGKVLKVDDITRRKRDLREVEQGDEYEVYIERTICNNDVEPGFFRVGNVSQPYPACCPQRILS